MRGEEVECEQLFDWAADCLPPCACMAHKLTGRSRRMRNRGMKSSAEIRGAMITRAPSLLALVKWWFERLDEDPFFVAQFIAQPGSPIPSLSPFSFLGIQLTVPQYHFEGRRRNEAPQPSILVLTLPVTHWQLHCERYELQGATARWPT